MTKITINVTDANVHVILMMMTESVPKCGRYFQDNYAEEISAIAREYPEDALKYGHTLLSKEDFNFCAMKDPDVGFQYAEKGMLTDETLEYWRDESPDTYGYWLAAELIDQGWHCEKCRADFMYNSCAGHLVCEEGCRVLAVEDAERILNTKTEGGRMSGELRDESGGELLEIKICRVQNRVTVHFGGGGKVVHPNVYGDVLGLVSGLPAGLGLCGCVDKELRKVGVLTLRKYHVFTYRLNEKQTPLEELNSFLSTFGISGGVDTFTEMGLHMTESFVRYLVSDLKKAHENLREPDCEITISVPL